MTSRPRLEALPWIALALLAALFPWRYFLSPGVPVGRDLAFYFYPMKVHLASAIRALEVPWLDPYRWGGTPLLAHPGAQAFYPANLLFALLAPGAAMKAWIALHVAVGVAGFFALARSAGLGPGAASVGAASFSLTGVTLSVQAFPTAAATLAWTPWLAAAAVHASRHPGAAGIARLAFAAAILLATANPEFVFCGSLFAFALALAARPLSDPAARPGRSALAVSAGGLLGAGLAAPVLLGSFVTALPSVRGPGGGTTEGFSSMGSLPPTRLVELLGDGLLVDWQSHELGPSGEGYPFFPSVTPGAVALALAGAGILAGGVGRAAAAVLSLVGILLSLGTATPAWKAVTWLVPPLRLVRFPEKYLVLAALGLAWLAALGVAALAERLPGRMRGAVPALALVLLLVEREGVARRLLPLEPAEALTAPPAVLVPVTSLAAPGQPPPRVFQQDLLVPVPAWHGAPVQSDRRLRRVALPAYGSLFGVGYVFEEDYDYSLPRSVTEWLRFLRRALPTGSPLPRAVVRGAGAVGTVRTSALRPGVSVPELRLEPEPLPPYRFAARVVADADDARLFARYLADSADPACAYVHRGDGSGAGVLAGPGSGPAGEGNVLSVSDGASALAVDVLVPGPVPAVLQLFRLREACLEATLDGREVEVLDANFGFAAVEVPAGRHRLVLRPPTGWLHWGVGLSGLSLLVLAGLVLAPCLRVESR